VQMVRRGRTGLALFRLTGFDDRLLRHLFVVILRFDVLLLLAAEAVALPHRRVPAPKPSEETQSLVLVVFTHDDGCLTVMYTRTFVLKMRRSGVLVATASLPVDGWMVDDDGDEASCFVC